MTRDSMAPKTEYDLERPSHSPEDLFPAPSD